MHGKRDHAKVLFNGYNAIVYCVGCIAWCVVLCVVLCVVYLTLCIDLATNFVATFVVLLFCCFVVLLITLCCGQRSAVAIH